MTVSTDQTADDLNVDVKQQPDDAPVGLQVTSASTAELSAATVMSLLAVGTDHVDTDHDDGMTSCPVDTMLQPTRINTTQSVQISCNNWMQQQASVVPTIAASYELSYEQLHNYPATADVTGALSAAVSNQMLTAQQMQSFVHQPAPHTVVCFSVFL